MVGITSYMILLDLTRKCLLSVSAKKRLSKHIFYSRISAPTCTLLKLQRELRFELRHTEDDCVSRSWNIICNVAFKDKRCSHTLILNNDVELSPNVLDPLVKFGMENPRFIITSPGIFDFSAFLISKDIYETVGPFDENLKGGSLEDWDYVERMKEKGIGLLQCTQFKAHHEKSATSNLVSNLPEITKLQEESKRYYRRKWGDGKHKLP